MFDCVLNTLLDIFLTTWNIQHRRELLFAIHTGETIHLLRNLQSLVDNKKRFCLSKVFM